jgi:hypothetical protein
MPFDPNSLPPSSAVVTPDDARPLLRHHFWDYPYSVKSGGNPVYDGSHPLWAVDGVTPMARVLVDSLQPPPGVSKSYAATAAGAAECVADHVAYSKARTEAAGRAYTSYGFFLQNWGNPHPSDPELDRTNTFALARHWDDRVTGGTVTDANAVHNPYCANGIEQLQGWTVDFLTALGYELEARNLPAPTDIHWDWEARYLVANMIPTPDGSWPRIILEDRYDTELIDGESTLAELYAAARTSTGAALTVNTGQGAFTATNAEWTEWQTMLGLRVQEWALDQSLYAPARARFPGIRCGNYNFLSRVPEQTWWRRDKAYFPTVTSRDWPLRFSDYSATELYPIPASAIDANGASNLAGWLAAYGITPSGNDVTDLRTLWLTRSKNTLRAMATYPGPRIAAFMPFPGQFVEYTQGTLTLTIDDVEEIAMFAVSEIGVRDVIWWLNQDVLESFDPYTDLLIRLNAEASRVFGSAPTTRRSRRRNR